MLFLLGICVLAFGNNMANGMIFYIIFLMACIYVLLFFPKVMFWLLFKVNKANRIPMIVGLGLGKALIVSVKDILTRFYYSSCLTLIR